MSSDKSELFYGLWLLLGDNNAPKPLPEYRFHPVRKWRFDWAWPTLKVAVEVDGNAWAVKGGGRHSQDKDLEKTNYAVALGWRVFHFSPNMLNSDPAGCIELVMEALMGKSGL